MSIFRRHPTNAISIAKIAAVLICAAAAAFAVARLAVPYFIEALSSSFPSLWSFLRVWLVPPYLFITIHVIIAAIWKLSDQKLHRNPNEKTHDAVKPLDLSLDRDNAPRKAVSEDIILEPDVTSPISASKSAESCMTTDSEENAAVSSRFDFEKSEKEEAMDLEDTWETIVMKKSATWERSSETAAVAAEVAGERVVKRSVTFKEPPAVDGTDELNRRFEAFIKKNYDQIRSY